MSWSVLLARARGWHRIVLALLKEACCQLEQLNPASNEDVAHQYLVPASQVRDAEGEQNRVRSQILPSQDDAMRQDHCLPTATEWVSKLLLSPAENSVWVGTVGSTFFAGDATNSSIWKRQKLQGMELRSSVLIDRRALKQQNYDAAFRNFVSMLLDVKRFARLNTVWCYVVSQQVYLITARLYNCTPFKLKTEDSSLKTEDLRLKTQDIQDSSFC